MVGSQASVNPCRICCISFSYGIGSIRIYDRHEPVLGILLVLLDGECDGLFQEVGWFDAWMPPLLLAKDSNSTRKRHPTWLANALGSPASTLHWNELALKAVHHEGLNAGVLVKQIASGDLDANCSFGYYRL